MPETSRSSQESAPKRPGTGGENAGAECARRYASLAAGMGSPDLMAALEECTETLAPARRAQQELGQIIDEAATNAPTTLSLQEKGRLGNEDPKYLKSLIVEKYQELKGDEGQLREYLVKAGKELNRTDKKAFVNFLNALNILLNENYGVEKDKIESGGMGKDIIARSLDPGITSGTMKCGQISKIMLATLKDMGVEAYSVGGGAAMMNGPAGGHYATLVKVDDKTYAIVGLTESKMFKASNTVEAFKVATRISPDFMTSGIIQIHGQEDGDYYSKFALDEEAAFADELDPNSTKNLSDMKLDFADLDFLTETQKKGISNQLKTAKDSGLQIHSLTLRTAGSTMEGSAEQGVEVVFAGVNEKGEPRILSFDAAVAPDRQKMSMLWKAYSETAVKQFTVDIRAKENKQTTMYDKSASLGGKAEYTSTAALTPQDALRGGAHLTMDATSGDTFGGQMTDRFLTTGLGGEVAYIRTIGPVNLWVGAGADLMGVASRIDGTIDMGEGKTGSYEGGTFVVGGRFKESAGMRYAGDVTPRLHLDTAVVFSLVHDLGENRQDEQKVVVKTGTELQGRMSVVYQLTDEVGVMGELHGTQLTMPASENREGGYRVGVTVRPIQNLALTAYAGQDTSAETLKVGPREEVIEDGTSTTVGTKLSLIEGRFTAGAGVDVIAPDSGSVDIRPNATVGVGF